MRIKKTLEKLDLILMSLAVVVVFVVLLAQVFLRYVFNSPLIWSEELARYTFVWFTMLALGYNARTDNNISMTLLYTHLPKIVQRVLDILGYLVGIGLYAYLIPCSVQYLQSQAGIRSAAMKLPMTCLAVSVPVGFFLIILRLFVKLIFYLAGMLKKEGGI